MSLTYVLLNFSGASSGAALAAYSNYIYAGLNNVFPGQANYLFTSEFIQRQKLGDALNVCFYAEAELDADIVASGGLTSILKNPAQIATAPVLQKFQRLYGAGTGKPAQVPLMAVQSTSDGTVPYPVVDLAYRATCAAGGYPIQYEIYHAVDHGTSLGATSPVWLQFIADRFNGVAFTEECTITKHQAVDAAAAYLPRDFS